MDICFDYYDKVTSTNEIAKNQIDIGAEEGLVVLAWEQTNGRGRLGKTFHSPRGGIYLTLVLNSNEDSLKITSKAAVALVRAIKDVTDKDVKIKWVNDIIYNEKKVAGILAEVYKDKIILGVGINYTIKNDSFPEDIKDIAISLYNGNYKCDTDPLDLVNAFIKNMIYLIENKADDYIKEYIEKNIVIAKKVDIYKLGNKISTGEAVSIDNNCFLHVIEKNGNEVVLSSGEISVKI